MINCHVAVFFSDTVLMLDLLALTLLMMISFDRLAA
jgi:hypothetical protein